MTKAQKIIMWIFGLLISAILYLAGIGMNNEHGNVFVMLILPLLIIGGMFFVSFSKK